MSAAVIIIAIAATGELLMRFRKRWLAKINIAFTNRISGPFADSLPGFRILTQVGRKSAKVYRTTVNVFRAPQCLRDRACDEDVGEFDAAVNDPSGVSGIKGTAGTGARFGIECRSPKKQVLDNAGIGRVFFCSIIDIALVQSGEPLSCSSQGLKRLVW